MRNNHIEHSSIGGIQLGCLIRFRAMEIKTRLQNSRQAGLVPAGMVGKKGSPRHCRKHSGSFVNGILGKRYLLLLADEFH